VAEDTVAETGLEPARVAELQRSGDIQVIDVRRGYEWEAGRIGGARHVEMNDVCAAADTIARDAPVFFYCRSGNRSATVAQVFREAGWDARNMEGGLIAWAEAGLPLEPADGVVADPRPAT
jgi:rhodanese-related sulfurtransferase